MTDGDDTASRLYGLLPEVLRVRDAALAVEQPGGGTAPPLRQLVEILATQVDVLRGELDQLYDDQFIETCAEWAAPYLGDLVGYRLVHGRAPSALSTRAEIANTIAYRRRKGTAGMLEQLARDVTGWPARAVEYFERLATTQYLNHLRPHALGTADLRDREGLSWLSTMNGAFDDLAHTADVRRIAAPDPSPRGRHDITNVGIFLWRTEPMPLVRTPLRPQEPADGRRFRFDALGVDGPLFSRPVGEGDMAVLARPENVPLPLTVRWLADHLAEHYGLDRSLLLEVMTTDSAGGTAFEAVPVGSVRVCDLRDMPGGTGWANEPSSGVVAVDPALGRVWFGTAPDADAVPLATHHAGLAVPVGARTIRRSPATERPADLGLPAAPPEPEVLASGGGDLQPALVDVQDGGTVRIQDSSHWTTGLTVTTAAVPTGQPPVTVAVVSDLTARPVVDHPQGIRLEMAPGSTVLLEGLLVAGGPVVLEETGDEQPRTLVLRDCTLVPGLTRTTEGDPGSPERASLIVLDPFATVVLDGCVTGPVVAVEGSEVTVHASVVDAGSPAAVAWAGRDAGGGLRGASTGAELETGDGTAEAGNLRVVGSTFVGGLHVTRLDCSNSVLLAALDAGDPRPAPVWAQRRQVGCVRFSWLPPTSRTGRRFRCLPDREATPGQQLAMRPVFTSVRFGDPAYVQLRSVTPAAIRRGADDESEMGATHDLYTPQREDDLTVRLEEYLRFGLEAGIFHAT